jgi:hypothetical protein
VEVAVVSSSFWLLGRGIGSLLEIYGVFGAGSWPVLSTSLPFGYTEPKWGWVALGGAMSFDYRGDPACDQGSQCKSPQGCVSAL